MALRCSSPEKGTPPHLPATTTKRKIDMTEPTEPTAAEDDAAPTEAVPDDTGKDVGNEAAKYRRRLRDTEAERDALAQRVEAMQRGEVERLAGSRLADPADIWRDGATVTDLLGDDGSIDNTKVDGLLDGLVKSHSHWAATPAAQTPPRGGLKSGASATTPPKPKSWAEAIRNPDVQVQ